MAAHRQTRISVRTHFPLINWTNDRKLNPSSFINNTAPQEIKVNTGTYNNKSCYDYNLNFILFYFISFYFIWLWNPDVFFYKSSVFTRLSSRCSIKFRSSFFRFIFTFIFIFKIYQKISYRIDYSLVSWWAARPALAPVVTKYFGADPHTWPAVFKCPFLYKLTFILSETKSREEDARPILSANRSDCG